MKKKMLVVAISVISYFIYDYAADKIGKQTDVIEASGIIEVTTVTLSAPVNSKLIEAEYDEGDSIEAGKTAARMDDSLIEKQIQIINANIEAAETQVEAAEIQYVPGVNDIQIKIAEDNLNIAEAQLELYNQQIDELDIISPIDGVVLNKLSEEGEYLLPGTSIYEIGDLYHVICNIYIPEDKYGKIFLNQEVILTVDSYPDSEFEGLVSKISDEAEFTPKNIQTKQERAATVYRITINLENPDLQLKPGMPADVVINI